MIFIAILLIFVFYKTGVPKSKVWFIGSLSMFEILMTQPQLIVHNLGQAIRPPNTAEFINRSPV